MRRVASIPSSNSSPARYSAMLPQQPDPKGIQPKASSSSGPPPLPPSATMRKKTKMMTRARRGSSNPTWARIPSFIVNRDHPDHHGHEPFAPYHVPPDETRTRPLPLSARRNEDSPPTTFRPTERFLVSRHGQLPSPSNECRNLIFLAVVLLVLSAS
ncbi:hypothetical protein BHM03_00034934 [Ensete ventricosum]|nr:hypothetical protein BHM03_00034934 [Ensete ventricosum]